MKKYLSLPKRFLIPIAVALIIAVASIPSYYFYNQYQKSQQLLKNPTEAAKEEVNALVAKVGQLLELPQGEKPTVATVSDKDKLKDQAFFAKAENGDKVLIYTNAKKAILYRPSTNKVIDVAPVNIGSPSTNQTQSLRVALYNGTTTTGLTKTVETDLKAKLTNVEVVLKENAKKQDYAKTVVVDLTGSQKAMAQELASILGGEISSLPEGESKPKADLLIILGSDLK